ncbi:MAG: methionyl-tRNA formyltransferase [Aridibacter famidurans]|nr:methionyl-tRNA formyltransferase [Aridibacter famidurans]
MKLVFMGTPAVAVPSLAALVEAGHEVVAVWTQPDRRAGRGKQMTPPPVKAYAQEKGIPVLQPEKIKNKEAAERFSSHGAEAAVVVAYGKILPRAFLEAYPRGCINVHFSLLPKYRGAAPVNWAVVNGEDVTGVTTMMMDEGLDTGDVLLQKETPIAEDETADQLTGRLAHIGAELIVETLAGIDKIKPGKQDESNASYAPLMTKEDGRIKWSSDAADIERRVRGFQPFPRSYTSSPYGRLTIWKCRPVVDHTSKKDPGTVLKADEGRLVIGCGEGTALSVEEIQQEGKRRMRVEEFLNGTAIKAGDVLGG